MPKNGHGGRLDADPGEMGLEVRPRDRTIRKPASCYGDHDRRARPRRRKPCPRVRLGASARPHPRPSRGGDDFLYGGNDDDILVGGHGSDHLYGATGSDTFLVDTDSHKGIPNLSPLRGRGGLPSRRRLSRGLRPGRWTAAPSELIGVNTPEAIL